MIRFRHSLFTFRILVDKIINPVTFDKVSYEKVGKFHKYPPRTNEWESESMRDYRNGCSRCLEDWVSEWQWPEQILRSGLTACATTSYSFIIKIPTNNNKQIHCGTTWVAMGSTDGKSPFTALLLNPLSTTLSSLPRNLRAPFRAP